MASIQAPKMVTKAISSSLLLLMIIFSFSSLAASKTTLESGERQILLRIKEHWGNPMVLSSWNDSTNTSHCKWMGIECSADASVTNITLVNQNITRPIPAGICKLKNLSILDLSYNYIAASFPTFLYNCSNLLYLDLSQNYFVGVIPSDIYRLSPRLTHLILSANNFTGDIPISIGRLQAIQYLALDNNIFNVSFPTEIGNLSSLQTLWLAYNPFAPATIPSTFRNLTQLSFLWMTQTNLKGDIPEFIGELMEMSQLDLAWNSLSGSMPAGIWSLKKLRYLYLRANRLSGEINIDRPVGALGLEEIDVSMNQLTGYIPKKLGKLQNLSALFMYDNQFTGEIRLVLEGLSLLMWLEIHNNFYLYGTLPNRLPSELIWLDIHNNQFSGTLPNNLPSELIWLDIHDNQFTGTLPNNLPSELLLLDIHNNGFSGTLPNKLPSQLYKLDIDNNRFSGNIPSRAESLQILSARNNLLSGEIPPTLTEMSELRMLYLGENLISGQIPPGISQLKFLLVLDLSSNQLVGKIPAAIGSLRELTSLDLSFNQLSDSIPPQIGDLNLQILNLSSNRLSGEIPISLQTVANNRSFLSNPSLCASSELFNVPICKHGSDGLRTILIVVASLVLLMATVIIAIFIRRDRHGRSNCRDLPTWKMMSFYPHPLDFTESTILSGLAEDNLIGSGGGGKVYRVVLENHVAQMVAVKKIWNGRKLDSQLEKEFQAEVQVLGSIRHSNIVKLRSCLWRLDTKLLVYEYMENGSLDRWLHEKWRVGEQTEETSSHRVPLDWSTRLQIAVDVARGLCYMHHGCSPPIAHRDVKSSNILLDLNFRAKIADFGLARMLVKPGEPNTVSAVAGTFGYMAPECAYSRKVNEKMDVYSFGVILLELTTGREAKDGGEYDNLAGWAWRCLREADEVIDAIDQYIKEPTCVKEIALVFKLGVMCTSPLPSARPTIKDVLQILLRCQQTAANVIMV